MTKPIAPARAKPSHKVPKPETGYHHGELQEALIAASEAILAEQGAEGFTLPETRRRIISAMRRAF